MKALFVVALVMMAGWALEVAHPVFFDCEPLVVWTGADDPPTLYFCGRPWPVAWQKAQEGGRTRWETSLCGAPLGVWTVRVGPQSSAFLRVSREASVLEIVGVPPTARLFLDQSAYIVGETGAAFFLPRPGFHIIVVEHLCYRLEQGLDLRAGERTLLKISEFWDLQSSSVQVLPGHRVSLHMRVRSVLSLPYLEAEVDLPPGWRLVQFAEALAPVPAARVIARSFVVEVPQDAAEAVYRIRVRWHGQERTADLAVVRALSPWVVVGHWDVQRNEVDLAKPFALTYERMLWAASILGQPIPYSTAIMTPELLQAILERWASGEAG